MRYLIVIALLTAALLGTSLAHGESVQSGDLRVSFSGRFAPKSLPREIAAPVSVAIGGSVVSVDGGRPPELRRISIAVNRHGRIYTRGLPVCDSSVLETTSSEEALARCGSALLGTGRFEANVDFNSGEAFPVEGRILAFNGGSPRRPALLLHIHGSNPVNATVVLNFAITRPERGNFGTVFTTKIPRIASDLGYVTHISLRLDRRYRFKGEPRSFFSARCAAPPGFGGGPFAFVRGRFAFANGQTLSTTLTRVCRVR
jgi:hypothetical protein